MLKIKEMLNISLFKEFTLIAGENGLENRLNNIVILEYESINGHYEVFNDGDFILTSLFYAHNNEDLIYTSFQELLKRNVSGIAVKTVFFKDIPDKVKELANQNNLPIFLFESAYMEDLILSANELLKTKLQHIVFEEKITHLIETNKPSYEIASTIREINPSFHTNLIISYITAKSKSPNNTIDHYFRRLIYKKYKPLSQYVYSYIKYKSGMFLIYSFPDSLEPSVDHYHDIVFLLLRHLDINTNDLYMGICDSPMSMNQADIAMKQALYANYVCALENSSWKYYSSIGIYQFLCPLLHEHTTMENYQRSIYTIEEYDKSHTSNLLETLITYINTDGDISKTAAKMYQHPNTIRYRINKATSLLNFTDKHPYEQLYILIHIYLLLRCIESK